MQQVKTFPISLKETIMLSPTVRHFIFNIPDEVSFNFIPGQFITIHFDKDNKRLRRSYSIANHNTCDKQIEFAANYVESGPGSELLFNLKPHDTININGPFGRLVLKEEIPQRYIFIATSTGVTPYRAMRKLLNARIELQPNLQIVVLLGARTREEVLYTKEFVEWAENPRIKFFAYLSRNKDLELKDHERLGYVQNAFNELNLQASQDIVYLCGNPAMIDDSFEQLKLLGFTTTNVIREKYISS